MLRFLALLLLFFVTNPASAVKQDASNWDLKPPLKDIWSTKCRGNISDVRIDGGVAAFSTYQPGSFCSYGAIDLDTGKMLWEKTILKEEANVEVSRGIVTVTTSELEMRCQLKTGKEISRKKIERVIWPDIFLGNILYKVQDDGKMLAIDRKTKKTKWTLKIDDAKLAEKQMRSVGIRIATVSANDRLYLATEAGEVMCLRPDSGKVIWRHKSPINGGEKYARICEFKFDKQGLYVFHSSGVSRYNYDGKLLWNFKTPDDTEVPVIFNNSLVFFCMDGKIYAVNPQNGKMNWSAVISKYNERGCGGIFTTSNNILVSAQGGLLAFDARGKKIWEEPLRGYCAKIYKKSLIITDADTIALVGHGEQARPPATKSARAALAKKYAERFDKLTRKEEQMFANIDEEGFDAMMPVVLKRMDAYGKVAHIDDNKSIQTRNRLDAAVETLLYFACEQHTNQLLKLWSRINSSVSADSIIEWLEENGDKTLSVPYFINAVSTLPPTDRDGEENEAYSSAIHALIVSEDPKANEFLLKALADPKATGVLRNTIFANIAQHAGEAGLNAVIAAKDMNRNLPTLADYMKLDSIPLETASIEENEAPTAASILLRKVNDSKGETWGWISSDLSGTAAKIWLVKQIDGKWCNPIFTGAESQYEMNDNIVDSISTDEKHTKDSDGDGWSDLFEAALGTKPDSSDTDGDGLIDSQDKNPLAAPRQLNETEQIYAAAFEARFRFDDEFGPLKIGFPDTVPAFELMGREWVTFFVHYKDIAPVEEDDAPPSRVLVFAPPMYDFDEGLLDENSAPTILWNADKTEAKTAIKIPGHVIDVPGWEFHLKKIEGQWVVVEKSKIWL